MDSYQAKEKFIDCVRARPFLYDCTDALYKDNQVKEGAWNELAKELGLADGKAAKGEWKKIRDNFRDALKRKNATRSGQSGPQVTQYKYYNQMSFLIPFMTSRNNKSRDGSISPPFRGVKHEPDIVMTEESEDRTFPEIWSFEPPVKKSMTSNDRIFYDHTNSPFNKNHEDLNNSRYAYSNGHNTVLEHFFKAMYETVKDMEPKWQLEAKRKIFKIITDIEEDILKSHEESSSSLAQNRNDLHNS